MSVNLINLIKGQLGDSVLEQLGGLLGESAQNTRNAIDAGVPTILGSIADKVANDSNAADMFSKELDGLDAGTAVDFTGLLASEDQASMMEKGAGLLQGLFGDKLSGVTDLISQFSGIGGKSSSSLLSMILPVVLGAINKQKRIHGLDQAGALQMLGDQTDYISQAMPSGMGDLLNSSGLLSGLTGMLSGVAGDAVSGVTDAAAEVVDGAKDAASAAAGAVTDAAGDAVSAAGEAVSSVTDTATDMADSAKDAASNVASGVADTTSQAASSGGSMIKKFLPIAVGVLLILFILKSCM